MGRLVLLYRTTLGKKAIVAVTGIILFGFVALHMIGNLKSFLGDEADGTAAVDAYARFLMTMGEPALPHGFALWSVRIILLVALILHVGTAIGLARRNRAARPVRYQGGHTRVEATFSARAMLWSGLLLLVFLVFHILQFTTGTIDVTPIVPEDVYANLFHTFHEWFFALIYIGAMALLGLHLYHGVWSLFQTLGLDNPDRNRGLRLFAAISAVLIFIGFCAVPVFFFLGVMPEPTDPGTTGGQ